MALTSMRTPEQREADKAAVRRILGLPFEDFQSPRTVVSDRRDRTNGFRNGLAVERRRPDMKDRHGYREWIVPAASSLPPRYSIVERADTEYGGTYFYCTCPSWTTERVRGNDCKHIAQVIS